MDGRAQGKTYCVLSQVVLIGPLRAGPSPREAVFPETKHGKTIPVGSNKQPLVPDNGPIGSAPPPADRDAGCVCLLLTGWPVATGKEVSNELYRSA